MMKIIIRWKMMSLSLRKPLILALRWILMLFPTKQKIMEMEEQSLSSHRQT